MNSKFLKWIRLFLKKLIKRLFLIGRFRSKIQKDIWKIKILINFSWPTFWQFPLKLSIVESWSLIAILCDIAKWFMHMFNVFGNGFDQVVKILLYSFANWCLYWINGCCYVDWAINWTNSNTIMIKKSNIDVGA